MMKRILIRGGEVVTAVDRWTGDILIEDGKIAALGAALSADAEVHVVVASIRICPTRFCPKENTRPLTA
jgi:dihydropyrimidinase